MDANSTRSDIDRLITTSTITMAGNVQAMDVASSPRGSLARRWDGTLDTLTDEEKDALATQRLLLYWGNRPGQKRIGLVIRVMAKSLLIAPPIANLNTPDECSRRLNIMTPDGQPRWMATMVLPIGARFNPHMNFSTSVMRASGVPNGFILGAPCIYTIFNEFREPSQWSPAFIERLGRTLLLKGVTHISHYGGADITRFLHGALEGPMLTQRTTDV